MNYLDSIEAFVAIVKFGSFKLAAKHLNVSQPALSRTIRSLEQKVQTTLLNRSTRHVNLAEDAQEYWSMCVDVLRRIREGEEKLKAAKYETGGYLRVLAHPAAVEAGLADLIADLTQRTPSLRISLNVSETELRLNRGEYDVAIYPRPSVVDPEAIFRSLFITPYIATASPEYFERLPMRCADFETANHTFIDSRFSSIDGASTARFCGSERTVSDAGTVMYVGDTVALKLAAAGHGIAIVPELHTLQHLREGTLLRVPDSVLCVERELELGVAFMKGGILPTRVRIFVDACMAHFNSVLDSMASAGIESAIRQGGDLDIAA
jgi:DNA-binding transcriptional LysR family regulator